MTHIEFNRGAVWALARIVEMHDQPVSANDALNELNLSKCELKQCSEYDLAFLRRENTSIPLGEE